LKESELHLIRGNGVHTVTALQQWTDEECIDALRAAGTYHHPLKTKDYSKLLEIGEIKGPSVPLLHNRFGSWAQACALAGVECGVPIREYDRKWNVTELESFVDEFMLDVEIERKSFQEFETWLKGHEDYPSGATMRNRLGGWNSMRAASVERIEKRGINV
jgi:hypothetical protein